MVKSTENQLMRSGKLRARMLATLAVCSAALALPAAATTITYDNFQAPGGYTMADYATKWFNPYGLGEMAINDTRNFTGGSFNISAAPFQTAYDFSVYDHLKYLAVSNQSFDVPTDGRLTFSATIDAQTPGTQAGRTINGTYIQSGLPYQGTALEGQQAAAVLNMIDFSTGQLFDIFVSGSQAFTLIERLPSSVTNPALNPGDPGYVDLSLAYTQIIDVIDIGSGPHDVSITYSDVGSVTTTPGGCCSSKPSGPHAAGQDRTRPPARACGAEAPSSRSDRPSLASQSPVPHLGT